MIEGENMKNSFRVDQVLHGYATGHQMLAASCELDLDDRKKIDELSDLNGRCERENFINYYTGYPLKNGKKYVIAKTWYAYEMKRPGCVWTHSIIINTEDMPQISNLEDFIHLFKKPNNQEYSEYFDKLTINTQAKKIFPEYDNRKLQYVIYTVFSSIKPKYIVLDSKVNNLNHEFLMVLNGMPNEILKGFTFCTMCYDVRQYENLEFEYQMSDEKNIYRFKRDSDNRTICTNISMIKEYPYWVKCYQQSLLENSLSDLREFAQQYGERYLNLIDYNSLSRLYFALKRKKDISIQEYFESVDTVMNLKDTDFYQKTVERILDNKFYENYFKNQEYQILEMMDMKKFQLKKGHREIMEKKIICETPEKLYPIFKRYISGQLKKNEYSSVENIIMKLKPEDLKKVSQMEENICIVLVHINEELLISKDIWMQPTNFQRMLLYASPRELETNKINKILYIIIENGLENISEDMYNVYGDKIIPLLFDIFSKENTFDGDKFQKWFPILLKNQILLLNTIDRITRKKDREYLFLKINMHKKELLCSIQKDSWAKLYRQFMANEDNYNLKIKYAMQFIPVIFETNYRFEDALVKDIVGILYRELENNSLNFDDWNKLQYIFPQVEACYAWDKCLRIRRALEKKGYDLSIIYN